MFSDNNIISARQVYRLFVFDFIGLSTLILPAKLAAFSGNDGLFSILIGGVLASLYLWYLTKVLRGMDTDLLTFMEKSLPAWLSILVELFMVLHFIWMAGYGAYIFSDVMKLGLIKGESFTLILILILAAAGYAVSGGIECRARIYEVLFVIVFVLLFLMLFVAARDVDINYLSFFFQADKESVGKGSLAVFLCLTHLFLLLFFPAYVKKENWGKMEWAVGRALWFTILVLAVLYVILIGTFGEAALSTMRYPAVTLMSSIHLKGSFLKRLDAFMIAIWFFTLFAFVNVFLFYSCEILQKMAKFKKKEGKQWLFVTLLLVFFVAELFYHCEIEAFFFNYLCYIAGPLLLVLPAALLVFGKEGKGKKCLLGVLLFFVPFVQGCSATELENRCFPMMAVVDYRDGQVEFSYGFPNLSQSDNTDLEEAKVNATMTESGSFEACIRSYEKELSREADCNHLKVLVMGENLLQNPKQYDAMLSYLKETELYPRNTYVCVAEDIQALLECEEALPEDMGTYLESYLQNHESDRQIKLLNLGKLIDEQENQCETLELPYLQVRDGVIIWEQSVTI